MNSDTIILCNQWNNMDSCNPNLSAIIYNKIPEGNLSIIFSIKLPLRCNNTPNIKEPIIKDFNLLNLLIRIAKNIPLKIYSSQVATIKGCIIFSNLIDQNRKTVNTITMYIMKR